MLVKDLKEILKSGGFKGYSRMTKEELEKAIKRMKKPLQRKVNKKNSSNKITVSKRNIGKKLKMLKVRPNTVAKIISGKNIGKIIKIDKEVELPIINEFLSIPVGEEGGKGEKDVDDIKLEINTLAFSNNKPNLGIYCNSRISKNKMLERLNQLRKTYGNIMII